MELKSIDPVCLIHGKKASEHQCLYCCLCFKSLTIDECHELPNGKKEDVCLGCAKMERLMTKHYVFEETIKAFI